jgi:hypothetical protein
MVATNDDILLELKKIRKILSVPYKEELLIEKKLENSE